LQAQATHALDLSQQTASELMDKGPSLVIQPALGTPTQENPLPAVDYLEAWKNVKLPPGHVLAYVDGEMVVLPITPVKSRAHEESRVDVQGEATKAKTKDYKQTNEWSDETGLVVRESEAFPMNRVGRPVETLGS
jgi:hypothetical protein